MDGKLSQGLGDLKKGGLEPPLKLCYIWKDFVSYTCFCTFFMFHDSAAFKGGDIQNFGEGGRNWYGGI